MWRKAVTKSMALTAEERICEQKGEGRVVCREYWKLEPRNKHLSLCLQPCRGKEFFDHWHKYAVHPISLWMPQSSSSSLPLFWFHAHKQPLDYNLAFYVDFPTGENTLTSQHEHLVHLARGVLFVYECICVLVYTSVSSCTPGAAEVLILPALTEPARSSVPFCLHLPQQDWGQSITSQP